MDNNIFEQMMSRYPLDTSNDRRNATYEVMQQVVLSGLYRGGFFEHAAFYGGTCYGFSKDYSGIRKTWTSRCSPKTKVSP